jgi:hypothetical protein
MILQCVLFYMRPALDKLLYKNDEKTNHSKMGRGF